MVKAAREFQVFAKPLGAICNLDCHYCYYRKKESLYPEATSFRMSDAVLEEYIAQHLAASPAATVYFSWHGGEPTLLGLDYFHKILELQRKYQIPGQSIRNGLQTNGTLLDEDWCRFFKAEGFAVGISLDGPKEFHDRYRVTRGQEPTFEKAMRGYKLLRRYGIPGDVLCVVNAENVLHPTRVYRFFKEIKAPYLGLLPLVEPQPEQAGGVSDRTVPAEAFGAFLCTLFDEWLSRDVGRVKVQFFEEVAGLALGQEPSLCIFQETCGNVPVIEHNGDFYACDHFVDEAHRRGNIQETPFVELLESPAQRAFGESKRQDLPGYCRACEVRGMCNGGCPKDRLISTPEGERGLNYLCAGYKRFFTHCRPFVAELAALWRRQAPAGQERPAPDQPASAPAPIGRNAPCPCGSGRKYKKCCLGK